MTKMVYEICMDGEWHTFNLAPWTPGLGKLIKILNSRGVTGFRRVA